LINGGDTAWVLASSALVMLMAPGLAFFYGGMVRTRSVLNMLMMDFVCLAVVPVLWILFGYSVAFGNDATGLGLFGGLEHAGMRSVIGATVSSGPGHAIPMFAYVMFQLMFAVVTPALITGAIADRARFGSWVLFMALWSTLVYFPVARWVFDFSGYASSVNGGPAGGGWVANGPKAEDFAGGTAVHINAGAAALALALVLGRRQGWRALRRVPITCRSSCSAPACCGSAGTGSTPGRLSPRRTPRGSRSPTPPQARQSPCSGG
jgi:Amt family ammonium transporter